MFGDPDPYFDLQRRFRRALLSADHKRHRSGLTSGERDLALAMLEMSNREIFKETGLLVCWVGKPRLAEMASLEFEGVKGLRRRLRDHKGVVRRFDMAGLSADLLDLLRVRYPERVRAFAFDDRWLALVEKDLDLRSLWEDTAGGYARTRLARQVRLDLERPGTVVPLRGARRYPRAGSGGTPDSLEGTLVKDSCEGGPRVRGLRGPRTRSRKEDRSSGDPPLAPLLDLLPREAQGGRNVGHSWPDGEAGITPEPDEPSVIAGEAGEILPRERRAARRRPRRGFAAMAAGFAQAGVKRQLEQDRRAGRSSDLLVPPENSSPSAARNEKPAAELSDEEAARRRLEILDRTALVLRALKGDPEAREALEVPIAQTPSSGSRAS